jgi:hypothetical protein
VDDVNFSSWALLGVGESKRHTQIERSSSFRLLLIFPIEDFVTTLDSAEY